MKIIKFLAAPMMPSSEYLNPFFLFIHAAGGHTPTYHSDYHFHFIIFIILLLLSSFPRRSQSHSLHPIFFITRFNSFLTPSKPPSWTLLISTTRSTTIPSQKCQTQPFFHSPQPLRTLNHRAQQDSNCAIFLIGEPHLNSPAWLALRFYRKQHTHAHLEKQESVRALPPLL